MKKLPSLKSKSSLKIGHKTKDLKKEFRLLGNWDDIPIETYGEFHPKLLKKLNQPNSYLYTSMREDEFNIILDQGYIPKDIYATVNRENQVRSQDFGIAYEIDKEYLVEDPCMEGYQRVEEEWDNHDQVILKQDADFLDNATIRYVKKNGILYNVSYDKDLKPVLEQRV